MRLLDLLFPPRNDERALRKVSTETVIAHMQCALVGATRPEALALYPYTDPLARAAIHEAKYHGSAQAFALLAEALAEALPSYLAETLAGVSTQTVVVPIPLGQTRRRERGYNQAEEVARRAVRLVADPALTLHTGLLVRTRETPTQVSLARAAREENMRGAFAALPALLRAHANEPDTRYVVLDDVLTTGATLGAAIAAFVNAGIPRERILPVALAYQP